MLGFTNMNTNTTTLGILAASNIIVRFDGRDGDDAFEGQFTVAELVALLTEERMAAIAKLAADTSMHRKGACKFRCLPERIDAEEFMRVIDLIGTSGTGRFKVTVKDEAKAKNALKAHGMAPEQTEAEFLAKYGIPFITDPAKLAEHYKDVRASQAKDML